MGPLVLKGGCLLVSSGWADICGDEKWPFRCLEKVDELWKKPSVHIFLVEEPPTCMLSYSNSYLLFLISIYLGCKEIIIPVDIGNVKTVTCVWNYPLFIFTRKHKIDCFQINRYKIYNEDSQLLQIVMNLLMYSGQWWSSKACENWLSVTTPILLFVFLFIKNMSDKAML